MDNNTLQNFSYRIKIVQKLLNEARSFTDKELTFEFMCYTAGIDDVNSLYQLMRDGYEPSIEIKQKFVNTFGINKEWLLYGRGNSPFATNISSRQFSDDAMSILLYEDLYQIREFIPVVGTDEFGHLSIQIIRMIGEFDYEVYPFEYMMWSGAGGSGQRKIVQLYRFFRTASKLRFLSDAYHVTADKFQQLSCGIVAPALIKRVGNMSFFIDDILDLSEERIAKNSFVDTQDIIRVIKIIKKQLDGIDYINESSDINRIKKRNPFLWTWIKISNSSYSEILSHSKKRAIGNNTEIINDIRMRCRTLCDDLKSMEKWNNSLPEEKREKAVIDPNSSELIGLCDDILDFIRENENKTNDDIKKHISDLVNDISFIGADEECIRDLEDSFTMLMDNEVNNRRKVLFISHSKKDLEYVDALVDVLCRIGFCEENMICTSVPGFAIPSGENIYAWLVDKFRNYDIHIIYILSKNYYDSVPSLNEMGAAWALKHKWDAILLPGFNYNEMQGCIDKEQIVIKLDSDEATLRIGELKDRLSKEFCFNSIDGIRWEKYRDEFLHKVKDISEKLQLISVGDEEK